MTLLTCAMPVMLGLNYRVLPDAADIFAIRRGLSMTGLSGGSLTSFKQALGTRNRFGFQPRLSRLIIGTT
jgi:hypothetical protein